MDCHHNGASRCWLFRGWGAKKFHVHATAAESSSRRLRVSLLLDSGASGRRQRDHFQQDAQGKDDSDSLLFFVVSCNQYVPTHIKNHSSESVLPFCLSVIRSMYMLEIQLLESMPFVLTHEFTPSLTATIGQQTGLSQVSPPFHGRPPATARTLGNRLGTPSQSLHGRGCFGSG